ncbi:MAG: hypothetical protein ACT4PT_06765, partial [Methanobacteriota archaeon]
SEANRTMTWVLPNWQGTEASTVPVSVQARRPEALVARPTAEDARVQVTVDLRDADIALSGATGGGVGSLDIGVAVRLELFVMRIPDSVAPRLPAGVELEYVTADGIRLALARGVVPSTAIDDLEDLLRTRIEGALATLLSDDVPVDGGFVDDSLSAGNTTRGPRPVVFDARANISYPIDINVQPTSTAAVTLYTFKQSFRLPRVEGLQTTYHLVFPKGIALLDADAPGARVDPGVEDGRDFVEVTPEGQSTQATFTIAVTPAFVVRKFWFPILLVLLLAVLLVVGIVWSVRRLSRPPGKGGSRDRLAAEPAKKTGKGGGKEPPWFEE